ncbi:unnamed protein product, partial [Bubo scandiacus]
FSDTLLNVVMQISQKSRKFAWMAISEYSLADSSCMHDLCIYSNDMNKGYSEKLPGPFHSALTPENSL